MFFLFYATGISSQLSHDDVTIGVRSIRKKKLRKLIQRNFHPSGTRIRFGNRTEHETANICATRCVLLSVCVASRF